MTKPKLKVPHTLVILFSMVVLAQILTYVIPAGSFDRIGNAPLKRIASTTEISHAVLYLTSYEARFITGASLPIDGGTTVGR